MDILLHLGAHRCGSTTFQTYLRSEGAELCRRGLALWTPEETRSGRFAGLIRPPGPASAEVEHQAARSRSRIATEIDWLRDGGRRALLISEENMLGTVRGNLRRGQLYPEAAERLALFGADFAWAVTRVGLSIRAYEEFWASALAYGLGKGHRMPGADAIAALARQERRWRDLVVDVAVAFPAAEIVVWPAEGFAARPDAQLRLVAGTLAEGLRQTAAALVHNARPDRARLRKLLRLRGEAAAAASLPPGEGPWLPFDMAARQAMRDAYARDLDWLAGGADGFARFEPIPQGTQSPGADLTGWQAAAAGGAWQGGRSDEHRHAVA